MRQKPKIAFIINDSQFFLSHRMSLATACKEDFEVKVILPSSPLNQQIKEMGFDVLEYPLQKTGTNLLAEIKSIWHLIQILKQQKPDIVHSFTIKPAIYGTLAARVAKTPKIVVTITGLGYVFISQSFKARFLRPIVSMLYRFLFQNPKVKVIFQNPDDKSMFLKKSFVTVKQSQTVAGSGVDPQKFFPIQPASKTQGESFKILVPARMLWDKGIKEIVDAVLSLKSENNIKLILAGLSPKGNPSAIPEEQLREWELKGPITWLGHVSDMNKLYNEAALVCLPSYREGLPLSLLEASLCAKPILTTDVPGCNYLIQHNRNGLVVPAHSSKDLASAIKVLMKDPELQTQLARHAREIALSQFTTESINQEIRQIYSEI